MEEASLVPQASSPASMPDRDFFSMDLMQIIQLPSPQPTTQISPSPFGIEIERKREAKNGTIYKEYWERCFKGILVRDLGYQLTQKNMYEINSYVFVIYIYIYFFSFFLV